MINREFLSEDDLEKRGIARIRTLQKYRVLGKGPRYYKIGGAVRYSTSDIEAWLLSCAVMPGEPCRRPGYSHD